MRDGDEKEVGLTPGQQMFLMGKVAALEEALHAVALFLPEDEKKRLRSLAHAELDNQQATASIPAPYRVAHKAARYHVFDRLMLVLSDRPDNDNED